METENIYKEAKCPLCKMGLELKSDYYEHGMECKSCNSVFGILDRQKLLTIKNIQLWHTNHVNE